MGKQNRLLPQNWAIKINLKYKTIDTPKIESILKNLFRRFD
jgi:hypothetical protein